MEYAVRAKAKIEEMGRFWTLLIDGTIVSQKPDGNEIVASMKRARMRGDRLEWSETCFCSPPLQHERSTIYEQFFESMEIRPMEAFVPSDGERFWDYLKELSKRHPERNQEADMGSTHRYIPIRIL